METFKLGYANRTLGYRLPPKQVKSGAAIRGQLQRLGIYRESGHEHFYGCLTVPLFNAQGELVQMYGRRIGKVVTSDAPRHMYMRGPHRGIFNLPALSVSKDIILCEALIDAMTFWCAGFRNVTSAYGIEGFTPELQEAFGAHGIERVLIAYDADEAGNRAAEKLAPELSGMGLSVFRVNFPKGMDANEYAQKLKPAEKSLGTALRAAHWMAGARAVAVPRELENAQAYNHVAAETNGAHSSLRARDVAEVEELAPEFVVHEVHEHLVVNDEHVVGPIAPDVELNQAEEPSLLPPLVADVEDERIVEAAVEGTRAASRASWSNSPSPGSPTSGPRVEVTDEQVVIVLGDRKWRVRGLAKNLSPTQLKVNVLVARGDAFFVDQLELNSARHRAAFLTQAARELETEERVLKRDFGLVFQKLEELQDAAIQRALEPQTKQAPEMSEAEKSEALALLRDPKLLDRILADFDRAGVIGEETNKLVGYLAAVSRKLPAPLGVVIQSTSAAGKSSLTDAVLSFMHEGARAVQRDDRPEPLLHGRGRPAAQNPRHRRGGRRLECELRAEAPAERGRAHDRLDGEEPRRRSARDAGVPRDFGLAKQLASEAGSAELLAGGGKVMAGAGTKTSIRDVARLVAEHGGQPGDWAKVRSTT